MKIVKRILLWILALAVVLIIVVSLYAKYVYSVSYNEKKQVVDLSGNVEILYDSFGVPHIYAQNEQDAYYALGYAHAKDRLFQMELVKRIGSGRLAEMLGSDLVETDRFFRTIGIQRTAIESVNYFLSDTTEQFQKDAFAYLKGVNEFIKNGPTPIEYDLLGIEKEEFTEYDMYAVAGYMAFSFAEAFAVDPVMDFVSENFGKEYLNDLPVKSLDNAVKSKTDTLMAADFKKKLTAHLNKITNHLPFPRWIGSNSWIVSGQKTKNKKPILCNDTHMGFAQPAVWFEAHLNYPGYNAIGNYVAGVPFALLGNTKEYAWGITMFENDDIDLYREKITPEKPYECLYDSMWTEVFILQETIHVKDSLDVEFDVKITPHGPLLNELLNDIKYKDMPVAMWWTYTKTQNKLLQAFYGMNHAQNMQDFEAGVAKIAAPGLNVMYADNSGNIAWWAAAKLVERPANVNSKLIIDGSNSKNDPIGWYEFSDNPHMINPESGMIYTANNQPDTMNGKFYSGYYAPRSRVGRIKTLLEKDTEWTTEKFQKMMFDNQSDVFASLAKEMVAVVKETDHSGLNNSEVALEKLKIWNGQHNESDIAPTIFYKLLWNVINGAMIDELGDTYFNAIQNTHAMAQTYDYLIRNKKSVWWDNVLTKKKETRKDVFANAFEKTIKELNNQLGGNVNRWQWKNVHLIEHKHLIGRKKPFNLFFNVGPRGVSGGSQVINNIDFSLNSEGLYTARYGPAVRRIVDFSNTKYIYSVIPTGQSGNVFSVHYDDQFELYNKGEFRKIFLNKQDLENFSTGVTLFSKQ